MRHGNYISELTLSLILAKNVHNNFFTRLLIQSQISCLNEPATVHELLRAFLFNVDALMAIHYSSNRATSVQDRERWRALSQSAIFGTADYVRHANFRNDSRLKKRRTNISFIRSAEFCQAV